MKNKKIFNAIKTGIANALIIDDNDSSINYNHTDIQSLTDIPEVSLDELYSIFKNDNESIYMFNTKNCLTFILDNGKEISLHEYSLKDKPVFLKITNSVLSESGNEIIIAFDYNHYIKNNLKWSMHYQQLLPNDMQCNAEIQAKNIISGFERSKYCMKMSQKIYNILPAIEYCNDIESPIPGYKGFLPASGQLQIILNYIDMINYIFSDFRYYPLSLKTDEWWSCCENGTCAWLLNDGKLEFYGKIYSCSDIKALPLFKKVKNK